MDAEARGHVRAVIQRVRSAEVRVDGGSSGRSVPVTIVLER